MKLKTKLTSICAVLLFLVAISLSGAMLWQVREQSYKTLTQRSEEKLAGLVNAFGEAVVRDYSSAGTTSSQKAVLQYCFRNCGVDGSVLAPPSQLQESAEHIADGNYAERVRVSSKDEVGLLAEDFNHMAAAVESHVAYLTEQNIRQQLFIGGVTHELKTPLTSLLLNVDTLRTVYLPEEKQQALLESMDGQLHWLEQMVHKLISLGKSAQIKPSSVPELLEQVEKMARQIMEKYGTILEISCTADLLPMDEDLLCSALLNLIENSAKASAPGQTIRLRAEGNRLEVSDSGRGIPQKALDRITDPF